MKRPTNFILIIFTIILTFTATACTHAEFKKVKNECLQIAGTIINAENDCFTLDTYPEEYNNLSSEMREWLAPTTRDNTIKAIKYANDALGFNKSLYNQMVTTTALMGIQTAENEKYKVTWTYHPNRGLEVTYEIK